MIEVIIKVTGEDQTLSQKFLIHSEGLSLSHQDPLLSKMVEDTISNFKGIVDDVLVKIKYQW